MKLVRSAVTLRGFIDVPAQSLTMTPARNNAASAIIAAADGDRRATRWLVQSHQRAVYQLVWRMLGRGASPARAEELTQEVFVRVFRALPSFRVDGPAKFSTWVLTIATRTAIDELRRGRLEIAPLFEDEADPSVRDRPDHQAERAELGAAIRRAVEELGPAPRAAFILRAYHGLSLTEIADALEIDIGTVKSRLHRARQGLQSALQEVRNA